MPVHKVYRDGSLIGYRWGSSGKLYSIVKYGQLSAQGLAARQGQAIYSSGYIPKRKVVIKRRDGVKQKYTVKKK